MSRALDKKELVRELMRRDHHDEKVIGLLRLIAFEVIETSAMLDEVNRKLDQILLLEAAERPRIKLYAALTPKDGS